MTPNWDFLLDETSLATVLPNEYVHFARPIRDGLAIFLAGLDAADQASLLGSQAKLLPSASISERLARLAQGCPVLQKLGQVLARDQRLPVQLRKHLQQLESLPPTIPLEMIQRTLRKELGPLARRGITLTPPAIAEASVAVVIPFRQHGSHLARSPSVADAAETSGVFKILKPGIEDRLAHELNLLERVGEHLDQRCDELKLPQIEYKETFQQVRDKLGDEVQLENEQRHLAQAKQFFDDEPRIQIPDVLDHCTPRVTAMSRIRGVKVTEHGLDCHFKKRRLAGLIARTLITRSIFAQADQAMFHGDPHAGNLFYTVDDRLAILDWSLVGRLSGQQRVDIVQVMLGAITLDPERIVSLLAQQSSRAPDSAVLQSIVVTWIRRIRKGQFPGLSWLVGMLDDAVQNARLSVTADMMLFRKTLHTLEGVLAEVDDSGHIDRVLFTEFVRHFAVEWPERWLRLPYSRDFATRLSNLDLAHTVLSLPAAIGRFWTGHASDALAAFAHTTGVNPKLNMPNSSDNSTTHSISEPKPQPELSCPSNV